MERHPSAPDHSAHNGLVVRGDEYKRMSDEAKDAAEDMSIRELLTPERINLYNEPDTLRLFGDYVQLAHKHRKLVDAYKALARDRGDVLSREDIESRDTREDIARLESQVRRLQIEVGRRRLAHLDDGRREGGRVHWADSPHDHAREHSCDAEDCCCDPENLGDFYLGARGGFSRRY